MLNYEFPPIGGGAANAHRCLLTQYANQSDIGIDVLTSAPKIGFSREKFSDNITIYKVGLHKKSLHFWRRIEVVEWLAKARSPYRRLIKENDYDLVHAFFGFPTGWLCRLSAAKLPYVISLRGSDVPGGNVRFTLDYKIFGPLVFKPIWKNAATLVACSEGLRRRALRFMPLASIDVITNGVDLERFHPAGDSNRPGNTKAPAERLRLLTVGRLSATKRVDMLIEAVRILSHNGPFVHLTIVGGGALGPELKRSVAEAGLGDTIEVTGRIDPEKMPQVYRQHHIFVSASMQEGMSNAMLEAMASGLPIVATRCEGVDELIADNGIVVDQADPEGIADVIRKLAAEPETRISQSIAARKRADKFSWDGVASSYLELYHKVLD
jgi:glycosyltransferase involved in cell wall biosynthesis